jgi:1-acyl-sn-glycerol-3-phosphate acyltransferase
VRPPSRWLRRVLLAPLVLLLSLGLVVTAPLWMLVTLVVSPFTPGRLRPLRLLWLVTVYLLVEAVVLVALFGLWVVSGCGWKVRGPTFQPAHYRLCAVALRVLYRQAAWVLRLTVRIEGTDPDSLPRDRPVLVLCRHAGPGDSFLLVHALLNWYTRQPRIVLKDSLQWDPAIDILLNRLPSTFIAPVRERQEDTAAQVGALAGALDGDDAFVIFPEGGNFTPKRWMKAITRLRQLGLTRMARRAEAMHNVLPPRPGGVLAALDAAPGADIVFVAHTGVDQLLTVADVWRELPMDKMITMQWWLEPADAVPAGADKRVEWLYRWWARIDAWIDDNRPAEAPPPSLWFTGRR